MDIQAYITKCWQGKERLSKVFWYWFVLVPAVLTVTVAGVLKFVYPLMRMEEWLHYALMFAFVYGPWVLISMWRGAFNVEWKGWGYLARIWVVVFSTVTAVLLSSPFWLPWLYSLGY